MQRDMAKSVDMVCVADDALHSFHWEAGKLFGVFKSFVALRLCGGVLGRHQA